MGRIFKVETSTAPWLVQAIEQQGTQITYANLLYSMNSALDQLSASQGTAAPFKVPPQAAGMFGGMLDRLVSNPLRGSPHAQVSSPQLSSIRDMGACEGLPGEACADVAASFAVAEQQAADAVC